MEGLAGKHIVITRPSHQSAQIQKWLQQQHAKVSLLPLIEIKGLETHNLPYANCADWFIFISSNAVKYGLKQLAIERVDFSEKTIAAIGKKTAKTLSQSNISIDVVPEDTFTTERFLELEQTQPVKGKRILIFRGKGGRNCLAKGLQQRGAKVEYAEVYQRVCPAQNTDALKYHWQQQLLDIVVITSSEGLRNLYSMSRGDWIKNVPLLLSSQRMKLAATDLGHLGKIIMAENPSDEAVFSCLLDWAKQESN